MLNRNKHTELQDASAKGKHDCARCSAKVTEDDKWVTACEKTFHLRCFTCITCNKSLQGAPQYFEHQGQPQCAACEEKAQPECGQCHKKIPGTEASIKALEQTWHQACFMCNKCHKKLGQGNNTFCEKNGKPYCQGCA